MKFRYSTVEGLNRYLNDPVNEKDCFYLTNPGSARLYEELKRRKVKFNISWTDDISDPSLISFQIGGEMILSSANYRPLYFKMKEEWKYIDNIINELNRDF